MELNLLSPAEAAYWAASIALKGEAVAPRGIPTLEVQNFTMHVNNPWISPYLPERNARPRIGAVEALQLVGQIADPIAVEHASKTMMQYADDGLFHGAYGQRAYGQFNRIAEALQNDHATRQAVATIHGGLVDLGTHGMRDVPCTLTLQFLWQPRERLGLRVSMRSNDVWLGLPYDLFQFTSLQCAMADGLGVIPGTYVHTVGSLHVYERDIAAVGTLRAPSQPLAHERIYTPRWGGKDWPANSDRARRIIGGHLVDNPTDYELALAASIAAPYVP